jgi:cobalt-zinc-cadmium efflux system protein
VAHDAHPTSSPSAPPPTALLRRALLLTLAFAAVEAVAGWWTGSLALLGDAGHMLADSGGLALALVASHVAGRGPSRRFTYGLGRVEVVAAVVNGLVLAGLVVWLGIEAFARLRDPPAIRAVPALVVAGIGAGTNVLIAWMLHRGEQTLNVRAAFLHVMGDLLGSLAALASNGIVLATGWLAADPVLSLAIGLLILWSAFRVVRDGAHILLEGVPGHLSLDAIATAMGEAPGVVSVHDLHVWQVSSREVALSAHVVLADAATWERTLGDVRRVVEERFGIDHATLQPERGVPPVQIRTLGAEDDVSAGP